MMISNISRKQAKRARRRAALARQKRRALQVYPHDTKARSANHLKTCSCPMCGSPRRWFREPTIAEIRAEEAARFDVKDLASDSLPAR